MTCPDLERLESFLAGDDIGAADHLASCPRCSERLDELRLHAGLHRELREHDDLVRGTPRLEGYDLLRELGRGGMGVVYEAFHRPTKRRVAVKTLSSRCSSRSRTGRRFVREIELVADMRHPNIVTVHDSGTTADGHLFFVMELVRGCDLRTYLSRFDGRSRSTGERLELFCRICEPIVYAHRRGVIHRDLTPSNILVDDDGEPRIVDFGLAKEYRGSPGASGLTLPGEFLGSLSWAAPEQVRGSPETHDVRIDVHALGLLLYWLLTGKPPYRVDGSMADAVQSILHDRPVPPSYEGAAGRFGADLDAIVLRALEKEQDDRYASVEALLEDVRRLLDGRAIAARRQTGWYRARKVARRHPVWTTAVVALVAGVVVVLVSAQRRADRHASEQSQSRVTRARLEAAQGHTVRAEELLWRELFFPPRADAFPPDPARGIPDGLRRTFWGLFELYARAPCVNTRSLGGPAVALSLGAGQLAVVPEEGTGVELYDLPDLRRSRRLDHDAPVLGLTRSADGDRIATWTESELLLWRCGIGGPSRELSIPIGTVLDACFDLESRWLVALCGDGPMVRRWSLDTGTEDPVGRIDLAENPLTVGWLGSGDLLVVAGYTAARRQELLLYSPEGILADRFGVEGQYATWRTSEDGRFLHTARCLTRPHVIDAGDVRARVHLPQAEMAQHGYTHTSIAPGAPVLACSGGPRESIELRSLTSTRTATLQGHSAQVHLLAFSPDGRTLATCDRSGLLRLWLVHDAVQRVTREVAQDRTVQALAFDPGSGLVAVVGEGAVRVWNPDTGRVVEEGGEELVPPRGGFSSLAIHPDGSGRAVAGATDGSIHSWRIGGPVEPEPLISRDSVPCGAAYDGAGRRLALGWEHHVVVLDADTGEVELAHEVESGRMRALVWSADGRHLVGTGTTDRTGGREGFVLRLGVADGGARTEVRPRAIRSVAAHPSQPIVVTGSDEGRISVGTIDGRDWTFLEPRHEASVYAVAFTPDGTLLASGDRLGLVKIWDASTWEELAELDAYPEPIFDLEFGPEGLVLAVAGIGQEVVFRDFDDVFERVARNVEHQRAVHDPEGRSRTADSIARWAALGLGRSRARAGAAPARTDR